MYQVLGDANLWLASTYEWQVSGLPYQRPENWADVAYWRSRTDADLPSLSITERATRFAVCLHTAWGNRWKTTDEGAFTDSTAPVNKRWVEPNYLGPKIDAFFDHHWLFPHDRVNAQRWLETLANVQPEDLVYLDPPYPETLGYGNQTWTVGDLLDVVDWCSSAKANVVVSNVSHVERLFARMGFRCSLVDGPKASKTRRVRRELVAHNLEEPDNLSGLIPG